MHVAVGLFVRDKDRERHKEKEGHKDRDACEDTQCQVTNLITSSEACTLQLDFCQRQRQRKK